MTRATALLGTDILVLAEDAARLSPLRLTHISVLSLSHSGFDGLVARGELQPLRDPVAHDEGRGVAA